jgi:hypothetical protein
MSRRHPIWMIASTHALPRCPNGQCTPSRSHALADGADHWNRVTPTHGSDRDSGRIRMAGATHEACLWLNETFGSDRASSWPWATWRSIAHGQPKRSLPRSLRQPATPTTTTELDVGRGALNPTATSADRLFVMAERSARIVPGAPTFPRA